MKFMHLLFSAKEMICDAKHWPLGQKCGQKSPIYPQMLTSNHLHPPRRFPLPTELDLLIENLKTFAQTMLCTERLISCSSLQTFIQQECIPVGCVPSATVAVCFQGGPHTPLLEQPPPWSRPPPPGADPPAARHAGIPPAMHAGIAPPMDRMTDMRKNITFATSLLMVIIKHIYTGTQVVLSTGKWFRDTMS